MDVEADRLYSDVWPDASVEERRQLLVDAGVVSTIWPGGCDLATDLGSVLGEGSADQLKQARACC